MWQAGKCIHIVYEIEICGNVIYGYVKMSEWKVFHLACTLELFIAHSHTCFHFTHPGQYFNQLPAPDFHALDAVVTYSSHFAFSLLYGCHCCTCTCLAAACLPVNHSTLYLRQSEVCLYLHLFLFLFPCCFVQNAVTLIHCMAKNKLPTETME